MLFSSCGLLLTFRRVTAADEIMFSVVVVDGCNITSRVGAYVVCKKMSSHATYKLSALKRNDKLTTNRAK
jgi:hypothetical protein